MNRSLVCLAMSMIFAYPAFSAPFLPTPLKLNAPPNIQYNFDGSSFTLPVTVSGTPASVTFLIFTKDRGASIGKVTNGYLGWHYVNGIDTCLYVSPPWQFQPGSRSIVWDGRDENGSPVPAGAYTYYIWGYDNVSPKQLASRNLPFGWGDHSIVQTHDTIGNPLSHPVIWSGEYMGSSDTAKRKRAKWIIGGDPEDDSLLETCTYVGEAGYSNMALDPKNHASFFTQYPKSDNTLVLRKMRWVPNGDGILQTEWGINGELSYPAFTTQHVFSGPVSDGADYLFCTDAGYTGGENESHIMYIDAMTATIVRKLDVSGWWVNPEDAKHNGQMTGGPIHLAFRNGWLQAGSLSSCVNQMIDPYGTDSDPTVWVNRNGDYVGDRNFDSSARYPWMCNDYNTGPYKYTTSIDASMFVTFPCYDMGAMSFGLYAPDGTGIGYFAFAGETSNLKYGNFFADYGSAYDGIYTDNQSALGNQTGWWYVAHDSIKGTITTSGQPFIFVTAPAGGETWGVGTTHSIRWFEIVGGKVKIEYSADNGSTWNMIADNVAAEPGLYEWTPTGIESSQCLVRVSSVNEPSIRGVSAKPFTITPPFVKVVSPNGGEVWETGIRNTIAWSSLGIDNVRIEISSDGGASWTIAAQSVSASQKAFSWTTPDTPSDRCLVRVNDAANAALSDVSDAPFTIKASFIQVITPNGGESWESRSTQTISWRTSSGVKNVAIKLSVDNGTTWNTLAESVTASAGSWPWRVSNSASSSCLIRVSDTGSTGLSDTSDGGFSITPSTSLWTIYTTEDGIGSDHIWSVTADPRGGVWAATGEGASYFNGVTWTTYTTSNSGLPSNNIYDVGVDRDNVLWFVPTWDAVTSYDGKNWIKHDQGPHSGRYMAVDGKNVKWIGTYGSGVARYDGVSWMYFNPSNSGVKATECQIPAVDIDDTMWFAYGYAHGISHYDGKNWTNYTTADGLAGDFTRGVTVDHNGVKWFGTTSGVSRFDGKTWKNYTTRDGLVDNRVECVTIDNENVLWVGTEGGASSFDGVTWTRYTESEGCLGNNHVYEIAVDNENVKWFATGGGGVSSCSLHSGPYVALSSPNGGELWESGSSHDITWLSKDVSRIRIEYSTDDGSTWNLVAAGVDASAKTFRWTLPAIQSFACKVRLTDESDVSHTDTSNGPFTISPPFVRLTSPNGGERWATGSPHALTWIALGVARVKIEYSTDGGSNWNVVNTVDAASGSYSWAIPLAESDRCLVRITDAEATERTDSSDAVFTIMQPYITVTAPNGGETWNAGGVQTIQWSSDGVDKVRLEYSVDSGLSWNRIANNYPASNGSYSWIPLQVGSTLCTVRVVDTSHESVSDTSDGVFRIVQILSVGEDMPRAFSVAPNHPNPFNPSTTIAFTLPERSPVTVAVYNVSGQRVATLLDRTVPAGRHSVIWNASGMSAGLYFCRVSAGREERTVKMLLVK